MLSFREFLHRANRFLHSTTSITLRPRPQVRILYLNGRSKVTTPETAEPMDFKTHLVEREQKAKTVMHQGGSLVVAHKSGWLDKVAREIEGKLYVETSLLLMENNEYGILLTTPKAEEKRT